MDKKRTGFWQWLKNIVKKRPFLCSWIVFFLLFYITDTQNIRPIDSYLFVPVVFIPYFYIYIFKPFLFIKDKRKFSVKFHAADKAKWIIIILFTIALPLIGIVAYKGMESSSRINVTKTNHSQTIKYISAELQKCSLGESTAMDGRITCSGNTAAKTVTAAVEFFFYFDQGGRFKGKNPYASENNARRSSTSNTSDSDVGYISLSASGSNIVIKSCHKTPCNKEANRQSSTVSIK